MARHPPGRDQKKAGEEGYVIGYVDESAFSFCPSVQRTYAPRGRTPLVKHGNLRGGVRAISMATPNGKLYYQVKEGSFTSEDIVAFLAMLLGRFKRKKLLVIWDGASIHRSELVKDFLRDKAKGRIHLEQLPAYSPELNVDEQVHGYIKKNLLPNRLFKKIEELKDAVINGYEYLKTQAHLIHNFFFHKETGFYPD